MIQSTASSDNDMNSDDINNESASTLAFKSKEGRDGLKTSPIIVKTRGFLARTDAKPLGARSYQFNFQVPFEYV
jgi:hypothetical protein